MDRPDQLEQSMWEFVYGLLPDDEAQAIRDQINADPDVARLYAEVKLRSDLVAEASRLRTSPMQFVATKASNAAAGRLDRSQPSPALPASAAGAAATALRWAVTLAATLLVGFVGFVYLKPQSPLRTVAYQTQRQQLADLPVEAMVLGPGRLQSQPSNHLAVVTRSLDGTARSTPVAYRLYGEDERLLDEAESRTDAAGILQIKTPALLAERQVRLEVRTPGDWDAEPLSHTFSVDPTELITHLSLDKPIVRPGQTVRFRTVTLTRYDLQADKEVAVATEIVDRDGNGLAWSASEELTQHGVRHGELQIPSDLPAGAYQVVARSPQGQFAEVTRELAVRQFAVPQFRKTLDFARESYSPGDQVTATLSIRRAEGGALSGAGLQIQAVVDGQTLLEQAGTTDQQGAFEVIFPLPDTIDRGEGRVLIAVDGETSEILSEAIPIQLGTFAVDFFPESGDLVAGVENRVYFRARNPQGKAVHVAGRVVDDGGRLQAEVRTERDGRGVFSLVPQADASYRLQIDTPADAGFQPQLPTIDPRRWLVLDGGAGVFEARSDLAIEIRATDCSRPLAITATCRGAVVGQEIVPANTFITRETQPHCGHRSIVLPVAEHAQGVIRLTAYDLSTQPAVPLAERLVYRRPHRKLQIHVNELKSRYVPGEQVDLRLHVRDETGQDQPAVLGVSVVDDLLLTLARDRSAGLTTHFWLTGQVGDARDLEDADFYLDPQRPEAVRALDLLLGTQGWRRLRPVHESLLAASGEPGERKAATPMLPTRTVAAREASAPLMVANNATQIRAWADRSLATLRSARELDLRRTGLTALAGGLIVMVAALILSFLRGAGGLRRWAPHLAAASFCAILGMFWVSAGIGPQGELSWARLPTSGIAERRVAEVPRELSTPGAPHEPAMMGNASIAVDEAVSEDFSGTANELDAYGRSEPELQTGGTDAPMDSRLRQRVLASADDKSSQLGIARDAQTETVRKDAVDLADREKQVDQAVKRVEKVQGEIAVEKPSRTPGAAAKFFAQAANAPGDPSSAGAVPKPAPRETPADNFAEAMAAPAAPPSAAPAPASSVQGPVIEEPSTEELARTLAGQESEEMLVRESGPAGQSERRQLAERPPSLARGGGVAGRPLARSAMSDDFPRAETDSATASPAAETPPTAAMRGSEEGAAIDGLQNALPMLAAPLVAREYPVWGFSSPTGANRFGEDLDATRYWNPIAVADQDGQYRLSFSLPEHQTTYRLSVDGHLDGRIGSKEAEVVVRKESP
ncbi:MAG: hypothetical protein KJ000_01255 [Pirellulaceae bacterium]|nr:hypothetical protein [Pirellulaceae bacterium]